MKTPTRKPVWKGDVLLGILREDIVLYYTCTSSFLGDAYKTLMDVVKISYHDIQVELKVLSNGTEQESPNNAGEGHTTTCRYLGHRRCYTSVCSLVFKDLICSWEVYVTECYILHSTSSDSTFVLFECAQVLRNVYDSDEKFDGQMISEISVRYEVRLNPLPSSTLLTPMTKRKL